MKAIDVKHDIALQIRMKRIVSLHLSAPSQASLVLHRSYNINKLAEQAVEEVLKIGTYCTCANFEVQDPQI